MRVLHVVNYGWPYVDGYTVRTRGLVGAQRRALGLDAQVVVSGFGAFARGRDEDLVTEGWGPDQHVAVHAPSRLPARVDALQRPTLGLAPAAEAAYRRGLADVVDQVRPDVVHAHHPAFVGRSAARVARERGLPFVYELRCFNGDYDLDTRNPYLLARGRRQNALETALARSADVAVTIADGLAGRLVDGGVARERVRVVRNAVDLGLFTPREEQPAGLQDPGVLRVGYATTFEAVEGLDTLVEAAALARDRLAAGGGPRLEVTLLGTGRDAGRVAGLVRERGLDDVVLLPGFVPAGSVRDRYAGWDLFVVPRRPDAAVAALTTPLKPLEAVAVGLPVLASDLPALRELLGAFDGVRFAQASPERLADELVRFAGDPWVPERPADLSGRAWDVEVRRYDDVYAAARARHPRG